MAESASTLRAPQSYWPTKYDIFGIQVTPTDYASAERLIIQAAKDRVPAMVDHMSVHGLTDFSDDPDSIRMMNAFDVVAPDGQPVRWALKWLWGHNLSDRVYGPELMKRLCASAAREGVAIYLYGSTNDVLGQLCRQLEVDYPGIRIVGAESPPFRALSAEEDAATVERINSSGAGLLFIGLGCPKQERFAYEHRDRIVPVQMCVGAAFDFLAGNKPMAPRWMQDRGLEWLYRLGCEPRRLWRRYLVADTKFVLKMVRELFRARARRRSTTVGA